MRSLVICPAETPDINIRETAAYGAEVIVADGQIDECGGSSARARRRAAGSTARP
jgi:threonine synthase